MAIDPAFFQNAGSNKDENELFTIHKIMTFFIFLLRNGSLFISYWVICIDEAWIFSFVPILNVVKIIIKSFHVYPLPSALVV